MLGLPSCTGFSLVSARRGHSLVVRQLLIAVDSPLGSTGSRCMGSVVAARKLSCSVACGAFLDQGPKPLSPALAGGLLTIELSGK